LLVQVESRLPVTDYKLAAPCRLSSGSGGSLQVGPASRIGSTAAPSAQRPRAVPARPAIPFRAGLLFDHAASRPTGTATPCVSRCCARQAAARSCCARATRSPRRSSTPPIFVGADVIPLRNGLSRRRDTWPSTPSTPSRPEITPGAAVRTDAEIDEWVRRTAESIYHPVGTCRMGADAMAVVDNELRVRGIDGLRIVDASVMPRSSAATRTRRR